MKKLLMLLTLLLSLTLCAAALADESLPRDVAAFFAADERNGHTVTDGVEIEDYYFAVSRKGGANHLFAFRRSGDGWEYWLHNSDAVPQGSGNLQVGNVMGYEDINTMETYPGPTLGVSMLHPSGEYPVAGACYALQGSRWLLVDCWAEDPVEFAAYFGPDTITYYEGAEPFAPAGSMRATVQRDIRYADLSNIPPTLAEAREKLTAAPLMPWSMELTARSIRFTGGRKYNVYSAPDAASVRGANGKAVVSTNSWIQVFGRENGYLLIQYSIDAERYRIGYISAEALPPSEEVPELSFHSTTAWTEYAVSLTDDPMFSQNPLASLRAGDEVRWLATLDGWAYVETTGRSLMRGFVPVNALRTDRTFDLNALSRGQAGGTLTVSAAGVATLEMTLTGSDPESFLLTDGAGAVLAIFTAGSITPCSVQVTLPSGVTCLCVVHVPADGTPGAELLRCSW